MIGTVLAQSASRGAIGLGAIALQLVLARSFGATGYGIFATITALATAWGSACLIAEPCPPECSLRSMVILSPYERRISVVASVLPSSTTITWIERGRASRRSITAAIVSCSFLAGTIAVTSTAPASSMAQRIPL